MHPYLTQELARSRARELERAAELNRAASTVLVVRPGEPHPVRRAVARRVIRAGVWLLGGDQRRRSLPVGVERRTATTAEGTPC